MLSNAPRNQMKYIAHFRKDGTVTEFTHTYKCLDCNKTFEINQETINVRIGSFLIA